MSYHAPIKDMLFNMQHLAHIEQVAQIPGFEDAGLDTAAAVLEECAKFTEGVLAPLNFEGDKNPSSWKDGVVTATPGFKDAFHQLTVDVREPEVAALEPEGEALVVNAEQVHDRGLEVVHVHGVLGRIVGEVITLAVRVTGLDACACEPTGVNVGMMIAAELLQIVHVALDEWRATELA